jgi:hypothetical protein
MVALLGSRKNFYQQHSSDIDDEYIKVINDEEKSKRTLKKWFVITKSLLSYIKKEASEGVKFVQWFEQLVNV